MKPVKFKEMQTTYVANGCGELPAYSFKDKNDNHQVITCWKAGIKERIKFLFTGTIWVNVIAKRPQPQYLSVDSPFIK